MGDKFLAILILFVFFPLWNPPAFAATQDGEFIIGKSISGSFRTKDNLAYSSIPLGFKYQRLFEEKSGSGFALLGHMDRATYYAGNGEKSGWNTHLGLGYLYRTDLSEFFIDSAFFLLPYNMLVSTSSETTQINGTSVKHSSLLKAQGNSGFALDVKLGFYYTKWIFSSLNLLVGLGFRITQQNFSKLNTQSVNSLGESTASTEKVAYQINVTSLVFSLGMKI